MKTAFSLKIGTRASLLAQAQAAEIKKKLVDYYELDPSSIEILSFVTEGDRRVQDPLRKWGGKGLFTREIESALLNGEIDLAVHSGKDLPTQTPKGLVLSNLLPREDPRDVWISNREICLQDLPLGAVLGTSSLRRQAILRSKRPDLKIIDFRGHVQTRLKKLSTGLADATLLAAAGLIRLGHAIAPHAFLPVSDVLPAPGQGILVLQTRSEDHLTQNYLTPFHHQKTDYEWKCERAFLKTLDGSCRTPIAAYAHLVADHLHFKGQILTPDGQISYSISQKGSKKNAEEIGIQAGHFLRDRAGIDFFKSWE